MQLKILFETIFYRPIFQNITKNFLRRDDPPGKTCLRAISELSDRSYSIQKSGSLSSPNFISLNEIKVNNVNTIQIMTELIASKKKVESFNLETEIPNFESQVVTSRLKFSSS